MINYKSFDCDWETSNYRNDPERSLTPPEDDCCDDEDGLDVDAYNDNQVLEVYFNGDSN
jgi:hypothetical protein